MQLETASGTSRRLGLVLVALCLAACYQKSADELDAAPAPVAADVKGAETGDGAVGVPPATVEDFSKMTPAELKDRAEKLDEGQRKEWDRVGRGYIESFESRVYDPRRDAKLLGVEAMARVRVGDAEATYEVLFDAGREKDEQSSVRAVAEAEGIPAGSLKFVRRWVAHGLAGAYNTVVYHLPPIRLLSMKSNVANAFIVVAPPFKHETSVSYSFDSRELVTRRGAAAMAGSREIADFDWEPWRSRYILNKITFLETDSDVLFEYSEHSGVLLPDRVLYRKGDATWDLTFEYTRVTLR